MKTNLGRAAWACLASALLCSTALAGEPIPGVDVKLPKDTRMQTSASGTSAQSRNPSRNEDINSTLSDVSTTRKADATASAHGGPQDAAILTSRSNKKHSNLGTTQQSGGPQDAAIITSRSNKKHSNLGTTQQAGGPQEAVGDPIPGKDVGLEHDPEAMKIGDKRLRPKPKLRQSTDSSGRK